MTGNRQNTRRRVLTTVAGVAGGMTLSSGAGGGQETTDTEQGTTDDGAQVRPTRQMVAPAVQPFEGNLVGQFIIATYPTKKEVSPTVIENCDFPNWAADETKLYQGMYLDRLRTDPQYVRVDLYMNGNQPTVNAGAPFIIGRKTSCPGDYVGIEAQSVPGSVVGDEPPGPTVTVDP